MDVQPAESNTASNVRRRTPLRPATDEPVFSFDVIGGCMRIVCGKLPVPEIISSSTLPDPRKGEKQREMMTSSVRIRTKQK